MYTREEIKRLSEAASEPGNTNAQNDLACAYYYGNGVTKNIGLAFELFKKAAKLGNQFAQYNLAFLFYSQSDTVYKDDKKAFKCYMLSAEQNNNKALRQLASCYIKGIGTKPDKIGAIDSLEKIVASEPRFDDCYLLGVLYREIDDEKSHNSFLRADLLLQRAAINYVPLTLIQITKRIEEHRHNESPADIKLTNAFCSDSLKDFSHIRHTIAPKNRFSEAEPNLFTFITDDITNVVLDDIDSIIVQDSSVETSHLCYNILQNLLSYGEDPSKELIIFKCSEDTSNRFDRLEKQLLKRLPEVRNKIKREARKSQKEYKESLKRQNANQGPLSERLFEASQRIAYISDGNKRYTNPLSAIIALFVMLLSGIVKLFEPQKRR